jgi:O-antigen/teichoic acid export membrane protein
VIAKILSHFKQSNGDHASQRNGRLLLSIATSVLAKFVAIGSTLITIPVTLNYLGAESFGVWMVISGVVGFMSFTDLGIGMGLQNALSKAFGKDDHISPKHYIINTYLIVTVLASSLALLFIAIFSILPIENLFKIDDKNLLTNAVIALKYSVLAFLLGMPIALIQRILGGLQKTYVANNVMLVGSVLSLLAIISAVYFDLGLVGLSVLFVLSPIITLLLYSVYFFYINPEFRPVLRNLSKSYVAPIVSAGAWTVLVQIIYTAKMNIPTMIISASLGLLAVAEYSVAQKLTGLAASMIGMALQPLWVVYGEAYHRGDKAWIENTLKKSIKFVLLLTVLAAIAFQFVGQPLIALWLDGEILPSRILIGCFSLWMIASTVNVSLSMLMNGTGNFKNQAKVSVIFVSISLLLVYLLSPIYGVISVILLMFLVSELFVIPFYIFECKRIINSI